MSDQRLSNPTTNPTTTPTPLDPTVATPAPALDARTSAAFLSQAFLWMFAGLIVSAGVSYWVTTSKPLQDFALDNLFLLFIGQIALVFVIGLGINKISATAALGLFFVYAASLGLTIGLIVYGYEPTSVAGAFLSASAMFGAAAIYGAVTKRSLAGLGGILFMGLIGLFAAMIINLFLQSSQVSWIISLVGVVIFTALTAYDVQRIQNGDLAVWTGSTEKAAVLGALHLYLDFVNLFLFLLRLLGSRN